jgi:vacuolar-type H+-ATPase subunit D/Vma8
MATSNFDFTVYNNLMKQANSGLRLFLALQMLQEVETVMRRYKNPLAKELVDLVDELSDIRDKNKAYIAKQQNTTDGSLDNASLPDGSNAARSSSADAGKLSDISGVQGVVVHTELPLATV